MPEMQIDTDASFDFDALLEGAPPPPEAGADLWVHPDGTWSREDEPAFVWSVAGALVDAVQLDRPAFAGGDDLF